MLVESHSTVMEPGGPGQVRKAVSAVLLYGLPARLARTEAFCAVDAHRASSQAKSEHASV